MQTRNPQNPRPTPSALKHAGTILATERKRKPKGPRQTKPGEKAPFIQEPVVVPPLVAERFASHTRYLPGKFGTKARYAMAHTVKVCPGADAWSEEDLWDVIGGWNSRLRGMKDIDGLTTRHHGQAAVQKVLLAMSRAEADPMLGPKLKRPIVQYVRAALRGLDSAVERLIDRDPSLALGPDEIAGMAPCDVDQGPQRIDLFKQPKTKSRIIATNAEPRANASVEATDATQFPISDILEVADVQPRTADVQSADTPIKRGLLKLKRIFAG